MKPEAKIFIENKDNVIDLEITTVFRPHTFIIDQILRIIILYLYLRYEFSGWWVILLNVLILIVESYFYNQNIEKNKKHYTSKINKEYAKENLSVSLGSSAPESILLTSTIIGFLFSYWFLYQSVENHEWYFHILFFIASLLGAFFFLLSPIATDFKNIKSKIKKYRVTSKNKKDNSVVDVTKYFPDILSDLNNTIPENIQLESVDYNDTQIAKLESELKSINNKVDAYLLESVLLGGLAFSGFLTVVSGNIINKESTVFNSFCKNIIDYSNQIKSAENIFNTLILRTFFHRNDLFILIMLLCLLSSVFFLLVLTLRIRFMSLSLEMDHLMRIMVIFNAKEEELTNIKYSTGKFEEAQQKRLEKIIKKIDFAISDAEKLMKELAPVVTMMSACRNIAILIFYSVLIVSGFYFSPIAAILIFGVFILISALRWTETLMKLSKVRELLSRHK